VPEVVRKSAAGGGDAQIVLPADMQRAVGMQVPSVNASDWSPDGGSLVVSSTTASSGFDLWLLPLEGGRKPVKYVQAPDGRLVAYTSGESGRFEVNVRTVVRSDRQWQVSTTGGYEPRWRGDGGEICYLSADQKLMASGRWPGPHVRRSPRAVPDESVSRGE
jgi:Tol biopolymer transport system component